MNFTNLTIGGFNEMQQLNGMTYEDIISKYCVLNTDNTYLLTFMLCCFVLIYTGLKILENMNIQIKSKFLNYFLYTLLVISEFGMFLDSAILLFWILKFNFRSDLLYNIGKRFLIIIMIVTIFWFIYNWLSIKDNRDKAIAIFKNIGNAPTEEKDQSLDKTDQESKTNGK